MFFDDRLATVLRQRVGSPAVARTQFRQLVDLVGTYRNDARISRIDFAYDRIKELAEIVPADVRAKILLEPGQRLRNPRLVTQFAQAEPAVATAAIKSARLTEDEWLALAPALPVHARGVLREKVILTPRMKTVFDQLGIRPKCLPDRTAKVAAKPVESYPSENIAVSAIVDKTPSISVQAPEKTDSPQADPATSVPPSATAPDQDGIAAIVRRIESFRKQRELEGEGTSASHPGLAGIPPQAIRQAFDFTTDSEGRITWAESPYTPMTVGLRLGALDADAALQATPAILAAIRRRQPLSRAMITISGAPAVEGPWQVDATPCFDPVSARFVGYRGRMRRPVAAPVPESDAPSPQQAQADSMRQMLHELRTPVNAIQGFAEVIQQQLFGPVPHEYRALAASIAGDAARILAGFEDLDRLARLETGALAIESGGCDIFECIAQSVRLLESFTAARKSGFHITRDSQQSVVAMAKREADAMLWRILATMAGTVAPGEILPIQIRSASDHLSISFGLPRVLAERDGDALFEALAGPSSQTLSVGVFGAGFALRLAMTEARAAGGSLLRTGSTILLTLPILTEASPDLSHTLASIEHREQD